MASRTACFHSLFDIHFVLLIRHLLIDFIFIMWSSILQNGRKKEKEISNNKTNHRPIDKSASLTNMSKSTLVVSTRQEQRIAITKQQMIPLCRKQNNNLSNVRLPPKVKQTPSALNILANRQNFLLNLSVATQDNDLTKKTVFRTVQDQSYSVVKTKKSNQTGMMDRQKLEKENEKKGPYFLRLLTKKNRLRSEFNINIHNSIFTFKEFMRACQVAHPKPVESRVPMEIENRKTIVFDMDETLIHTNETSTPNFEIKVPFRSFQGRIGFGFVEVRPHCKDILKRLSQHFDIIIFTASTQAYADPILDHIDPDRVVKCRLYRESCSLIKNQIFVKDLRVLGRKLSNVLLVDNAPYSYLMQLQNAIPIVPYYRGKDDDELLSLQDYIMKMKDMEDVRPANKEHFKLHEYTKFDSHEKLVSKLYGEHLK